MSLKDFISDHKGWIGTIGAAILGIIGVLTNRRVGNAGAGKSEAEENNIRFKTQMEREKYEKEKEELHQIKIDNLNKILIERMILIEDLKKEVRDKKVEIEELKAEVTFWKTLNSSK